MLKSISSVVLQLAVWLVISWFLISWVQGCVSAQPVATRSTGTVIQVDGDRVLVTFQVVDRNFSDQAVNWFYIPGHSYQLRDIYPDPDKDPSLLKTAYGNR